MTTKSDSLKCKRSDLGNPLDEGGQTCKAVNDGFCYNVSTRSEHEFGCDKPVHEEKCSEVTEECKKEAGTCCCQGKDFCNTNPKEQAVLAKRKDCHKTKGGTCQAAEFCYWFYKAPPKDVGGIGGKIAEELGGSLAGSQKVEKGCDQRLAGPKCVDHKTKEKTFCFEVKDDGKMCCCDKKKCNDKKAIKKQAPDDNEGRANYGNPIIVIFMCFLAKTIF